VVQEVETSLNELVRETARVADRPTPDAIAPLLERTGKHGALLDRLRQRVDPARVVAAGGARLHVVALLNDVEIVVWVVHRLAKTLSLLAEHPS
jgi:hypothetical protein